MGIRKAQVFTIRSSGLRQPISSYGKAYAYAYASLDDIIALSLSEVAIRGASEQIKCCVSYETRCKYIQKILITNYYLTKNMQNDRNFARFSTILVMSGEKSATHAFGNLCR